MFSARKLENESSLKKFHGHRQSRSRTRMMVMPNSLAAKRSKRKARSRKTEFGRSIPASSANSKIVKERIWINQVTSKIMKQPLESDTDAQLHEERVISVRKQADIDISSSTRENFPDEMKSSWQLFDVTKFQEEIKIAQKTAATHVP